MKIINNVATRKAVALAFFLLGTTSLGTAAPALWETDFGSPLSSLTGEDSAIEAVTRCLNKGWSNSISTTRVCC